MTELATQQHAPSEKRAKFIRLAEKRTAKAIKAIRTLGGLGNRNVYEFGDTDVHKIVTALAAEIEAIRDKMTTRDPKQAAFRL